MTLIEETRNVECLLETLYPERYSGVAGDDLQERVEHLALAMDRDTHCREMAGLVKQHLDQLARRLLETGTRREMLAAKIYLELASSAALWEEALHLIQACDAWWSSEVGASGGTVSGV